MQIEERNELLTDRIMYKRIRSKKIFVCMCAFRKKNKRIFVIILSERQKKTSSNNQDISLHIYVLDSMNRPLFRARNLDPSKRIRLLVDQHDDNNNTLTNPSSTSSSSSNNLLVSLSSTSNLQTSQQPTVSNSHLPQRCVPQMPFVSGMEREEEAVEYHMRKALDTCTQIFLSLGVPSSKRIGRSKTTRFRKNACCPNS